MKYIYHLMLILDYVAKSLQGKVCVLHFIMIFFSLIKEKLMNLLKAMEVLNRKVFR